jgi:hypothetical protein
MTVPRLSVLLVVALTLSAAPAPDRSSARIRAKFAHPPTEFGPAPLWVWNDMLTDDMVRHARRPGGSGVRQVFVHPRPGPATPYPGPMVRLWKVALDEAAPTRSQIYDETLSVRVAGGRPRQCPSHAVAASD